MSSGRVGLTGREVGGAVLARAGWGVLLALCLTGCLGTGLGGRGEPAEPVMDTPQLTKAVDALAKNQDQQRSVTSVIDQRMAQMERELSRLRGELEVAKHELATAQSAAAHRQEAGREEAEPLIPGDLPTIAATGEAEGGRKGGGAAEGSRVTEGGRAPPAGPPPKSAQAAYDESYQLLVKGQYEPAMEGFGKFVKWFPADPLAGVAQFWIGEIHAIQRRYPEALEAYNQVLVRWPNSSKVADSLLKLGFAFYELNDMENSRLSLERLIRDYPEAKPAVALARERLKAINRRGSAKPATP